MQAVSVNTGTDGTLRVVLRGEIDYTNAGQIMDVVRAALDSDRPAEIRVAMAEVTFLDSSGIGALVQVMRAAEKARATFRVVDPNPKVFDQLRIAGLLEAFGLVEPPSGG